LAPVAGSFLAPSATGLDGGSDPKGLALDGAGHMFVVTLEGLVFEIDTAGTTIFQSFSVPFRGGAIAFDGTSLYVGDFDSSTVNVVDRNGIFVRTFDAQSRPANMVFDPTRASLWSIDEFDSDLRQISTTGVVLRRCATPRHSGSQGLGALALVQDMLYIAEVTETTNPFTSTVFAMEMAGLVCARVQ
jgi:DNA-binding beta-propeller fold protein YncE